MEHKEIIKELDEAIKLNREARTKNNDAMCHAQNALARVVNADSDSYKQGLEDAWEIFKKLDNMAFNRDTYDDIFGPDRGPIDVIFHTMSIHEIKAKVDAWEKRKEEQAKPKLGDVVKCIRCGDDFQETGIIIIDGANTYTLLCQHDVKNYTVVLHKRDFVFEKTGKHFDVQSMLDEIG